MHKYIYSYLSIFLFIGISISSDAQNKQGNIVEYFGKEKVETINEGNLVHVFKEGLLLKKNSSIFYESTYTILSIQCS